MNYKRRKKLIAPALQLKMTAIFFGIACVGVITQTMLFNRGLLEISESLPAGSEILIAKLPGVLTRSLLTTVLLLAPMAFAVGILITFRIAGPLYRFKVYLGAIAKGENPGRCRIRERDELHDLCELINAAIDRLQVDGAKASSDDEPAADDESKLESLRKAS